MYTNKPINVLMWSKPLVHVCIIGIIPGESISKWVLTQGVGILIPGSNYHFCMDTEIFIHSTGWGIICEILKNKGSCYGEKTKVILPGWYFPVYCFKHVLKYDIDTP